MNPENLKKKPHILSNAIWISFSFFELSLWLKFCDLIDFRSFLHNRTVRLSKVYVWLEFTFTAANIYAKSPGCKQAFLFIQKKKNRFENWFVYLSLTNVGCKKNTQDYLTYSIFLKFVIPFICIRYCEPGSTNMRIGESVSFVLKVTFYL